MSHNSTGLTLPADTCNNYTIQIGQCNGLPICGFCYNFGQYHQPAPEYELYNMILICMILPILGFLGLIGNSLSAFVYSRKSMRSSLNCYLFSLAFSDATIISTSFFLFFLESMRKRSAFVSKYFALTAPLMFPLGLTAQSLSVFLTVSAAFDCFLQVIASDRIKEKICTPSTTKWVVMTNILLAVLFNLSHVFEISVIHCWNTHYSQPSYDVCPTELRQNEIYFTFYYAYLYTIVMAVGPVLLLIILNTAIVIIIKNTRQNDQSGDGSDITTFVLVVCLFIACNIMPLTVNFLELMLAIENSYLIDASNLMVVLNSSCNFIIYYVFGAQFRRTLKDEFPLAVYIKRSTLKYNAVDDDFLPESILCQTSVSSPLISALKADDEDVEQSTGRGDGSGKNGTGGGLVSQTGAEGSLLGQSGTGGSILQQSGTRSNFSFQNGTGSQVVGQSGTVSQETGLNGTARQGDSLAGTLGQVNNQNGTVGQFVSLNSTTGHVMTQNLQNSQSASHTSKPTSPTTKSTTQVHFTKKSIYQTSKTYSNPTEKATTPQSKKILGRGILKSKPAVIDEYLTDRPMPYSKTTGYDFKKQSTPLIAVIAPASPALLEINGNSKQNGKRCHV
ncbi:unnamed protein product [Bursaphelenchus okinawaensis]|uniref:G-protein coupled receptors family 1 profile domain-containing protein n=1 Tax=Bursaphelenchus okinawaensis TaxID=465554 RepID=A0A811LMN5_9BILA|nr:unnamed protein product [Bursaphelenchus okinawaensis]CAG9124391.1 unnamed protein product [Bursaphelenchus okinawaensis]